MKLWRLSQSENNGWDTYDSAVVAAETAEDAIRVSPDGDEWIDGKWKTVIKSGPRAGECYTAYCHGWCSPDKVSVTLIGEAADGVKAGVICASFNAG